MNKTEALAVIKVGGRVTHKLFLGDHFLEKHPTSTQHYFDEKKELVDIKHFWKYRTGPRWEREWEIFVKPIRRKYGARNSR
jgi:hypothetical protein